MKKILALAIGCFGVWNVSAQTHHLTEVKVVDQQVRKQGKQVEVKLQLDLSELQVKQQQSVQLFPAIVANEGEQRLELAPLIIEGGIRHRVHQRQKALNGVAPTDGAYSVLRKSDVRREPVAYQTSVAYEPWMAQSRLVLCEKLTGCLECQHGTAESTLRAPFVEPFVPQYRLPFVTPDKETVKRRSETRVARIQFRQNSDRILPDFKNNQAELEAVSQSIAQVKDHADLQITGIYITGYASPEGTVAYNQQLTERRAHALARYAQHDTHVDASLWHVTGAGEDWEGLREEVKKHPKLLRIEDVLQIIDLCEGNLDLCEQRIRALVPPTIYQRLLNEMYGPLRRNEYRIEYNVRSFDLAQARELLQTRPDLLSVDEIYTVADSYGKGTVEYEAAYLTAARTYPQQAAAVANAAALLLAKEDARGAIALIEASQAASDGKVLNVKGVAYAHLQEWAQADQTLQQAEAAGCTEAAENRKWVEQAKAECF